MIYIDFPKRFEDNSDKRSFVKSTRLFILLKFSL